MHDIDSILFYLSGNVYPAAWCWSCRGHPTILPPYLLLKITDKAKKGDWNFIDPVEEIWDDISDECVLDRVGRDGTGWDRVKPGHLSFADNMSQGKYMTR